MTIDQVKIVPYTKLEDAEIQAYIDYAQNTEPESKLTALTVELDGEFVNLKMTFNPVHFERIRRITGYLVGTMDRWNNAKVNEESDRVKHGLS